LGKGKVIDPSVAALVVPDKNWANKLIDKHEAEQDFKVMQFA
jgi:hypothetical protein